VAAGFPCDCATASIDHSTLIEMQTLKQARNTGILFTRLCMQKTIPAADLRLSIPILNTHDMPGGVVRVCCSDTVCCDLDEVAVGVIDVGAGAA
jgi:hypothetical protein